MKRVLTVAALAATTFGFGAGGLLTSASAATLMMDGDSYSDGSATFTAEDMDPTAGTGVLQPFLTIQASPIERGYNSDLGNASFEFDEKRSPGFTRAITLGELLAVDGYYYLFADFNEPNGNDQDTLSFLTFNIWTDADGFNNVAGTGNFEADNLVYSLGEQIDTKDFGGGSGQQDMTIKIDQTLFAGVSPSAYFMLHVIMGRNCTTARGQTTCSTESYETEGGFEEFTALTGETPPPIPLPAAGWLLLAGVGGLAAMRRKKAA